MTSPRKKNEMEIIEWKNTLTEMLVEFIMIIH